MPRVQVRTRQKVFHDCILYQSISLHFIPVGLKEMGVTENMIPSLVEHSETDPSNATTPKLPNRDEWEKLFLDSM